MEQAETITEATPTESEAHTHDGQVDVVIPRWVIWTVYGFGVGLCIAKAIEWYLDWQDRRAHDQIQFAKMQVAADVAQAFVPQKFNGHKPEYVPRHGNWVACEHRPDTKYISVDPCDKCIAKAEADESKVL